MSQPPTPPPPYQDPHGRPHGPAGRPGQPPAPYGVAPGQQPYPVPSPYARKDSGGKVAVIVVVAVIGFVLLFCGGFVGAVVWVVVEVDRAVDEATSEFDADRRGGPDNPIPVTEGEAFTIDGMSYAAGWRLRLDGGGDLGANEIVGLRATNDRDDGSAEYVSLDFTFLAGDEEVGEITCSSDGDIAAGRVETLGCMGYSEIPPYDAIEVAAGF